MRHIAITDHDSVEGIEEATYEAAGHLEVIPAIEINSVFIHDSGKREDVHVLGYFIDPTNTRLLEVIARQQSARKQHVLDSIQAVAALGINIDVASVQRHAGLGSIGRAHITLAIVESGGADDVNQAWERFMVRTSPHYVHRNSVSPLDAISAITASGGIASIAHPGNDADIDQLIFHLRECSGLAAIEAYHRIHSTNTTSRFIKLARDNGMLVTGGSDCHGPFEEFAPSMGSIPIPDEVLKNLRRRFDS